MKGVGHAGCAVGQTDGQKPKSGSVIHKSQLVDFGQQQVEGTAKTTSEIEGIVVTHIVDHYPVQAGTTQLELSKSICQSYCSFISAVLGPRRRSSRWLYRCQFLMCTASAGM